MKSLATWLLSVVLFAVIGGASVWLFIQGGGSEHEEHDEHAASAAPSEPEPVVARDETGCVVVRMDRQTQDRLGLEVKSLEAALDQQTVAAYGSVMEDPSQSFTVRAPMAGTVVAEGHNGWPRLGQVLPAGRAVGGLAPQLGPIEHADLASKLAAARADEQQARASLDALRASLQSKRQLHAEGRIVSDQLLQEVEARVAGEEARLRAAQQTVRVLEAWATPTSRPSGTLPLTGGKGGRVAEILAQPGETVDAAQPLLRLTSFDRLLARVSLPAGQRIARIASVSLVVS
ncbi:MAG: hypothetical protein HY718_18610, partial [Planctomycetes bacterium]|nr:hypothetical protein [Planctomycetota bacterium]